MFEAPLPDHVGATKSPGLAGFLEYICAGAGFFYCGEIRKGAWILIGTILANVLLFAAIMGLAVLPRDVYNGFLSLDGRLLGNIITALFFIAFGGNIIWLIARIIWVANIAAAHNEEQKATMEGFRPSDAEPTIS